jgi:hypothetical protein
MRRRPQGGFFHELSLFIAMVLAFIASYRTPQARNYAFYRILSIRVFFDEQGRLGAGL